MVMLSIIGFAGTIPRVDKRLLPSSAAQSAINCFTDTGKLQALRKAVRDGFAHNNPPVSLYKERTGAWLDWTTNVDVIRSPLDTVPDTLIYTGDGRPKIRAEDTATAYDLGLPAPVSAPTAIAVSASNSGEINNVERVVSLTNSYAVKSDNKAPNTDRYSEFNFEAVNVICDGVNALSFHYTPTIYGNYIDPQGDNVVVFDVYVSLFRDSSQVGRFKVGQAGWGGGTDITELSGDFIELPAAGTYAYSAKVEVRDGNNGMRCSCSMNLEVRRNNRMRVYSKTDHNLIEDANVRLDAIVATGEMPTKLNSKVFQVAEIISDTVFDIATMSEGAYASGGTWTQYWSAADVESRAYRYTYVTTINGVDYEGPASEASVVVDSGQGQAVTLSAFSPFPGSWNSPASKIRIYRYTAATSTTGQYQFVAEIPITDASYIDVILGENLGESLPDPAYDAPNENLKGLVELPNGGAAAFVGKTIYFAEPNYLHAWPASYARSAHDNVVAMGSFGASLAVATESQPYVLTGTDPANMTMDKVELSQPCVAKLGCVDFGYAWTYPSPDGLVLITTGRAEVITLSLFTEYQWRALNPASFRAARYDNQYVCFYEDVSGNRGGFMFDPLAPSKGVVMLDFWANAIWTDPTDGALYLARNNVISRFDYDTLEMDMRWRSKEFATPNVMFSAAKVEAQKYPVSISIFCDGQEVSSCQVYSKNAFRLGTPEGSVWSIEVRGQHQIDAIYVAENMRELGSAGRGA